jgi:hypothetical protein
MHLHSEKLSLNHSHLTGRHFSGESPLIEEGIFRLGFCSQYPHWGSWCDCRAFLSGSISARKAFLPDKPSYWTFGDLHREPLLTSASPAACREPLFTLRLCRSDPYQEPDAAGRPSDKRARQGQSARANRDREGEIREALQRLKRMFSFQEREQGEGISWRHRISKPQSEDPAIIIFPVLIQKLEDASVVRSC